LSKIPTQTKSFRLDADILEALDTESARHGTSVNNLTNQILRKWVNFDRYVQDFGYVMVSVHDFIRGLNTLDANSAKALATETGRRFPKDLMLFMGQKIDTKACIWFVESIICDYMKWSTYHASSNQNEYVLTLRHNYGQKWSMALEVMLSALFETNAKVVPKFTVTESTVLLVVEKPAQRETAKVPETVEGSGHQTEQ
jgi:hypothetical protein